MLFSCYGFHWIKCVKFNLHKVFMICYQTWHETAYGNLLMLQNILFWQEEIELVLQNEKTLTNFILG